MSSPALIALTQKGATTARRLLQIFPDAEIHAREGRVADAHSYFSSIKEVLPVLFTRGVPIIAFCSTGIIIRTLAPALNEKHVEPPVLALSEDGERIVPLLGGHRGGYTIAQEIAEHLGGWIASTGAGENRFGVMLDAPPVGYHLSNASDYPAFVAELLQQEKVCMNQDDGIPPPQWLTQSRLPWKKAAELSIHVTIREEQGNSKRLVYHPRTLLLGVGCERGVDTDELFALVNNVLRRENLSRDSIAAIVSVDVKMNEPALVQLGQILNVPVRFFSSERLERETPRLKNPSREVFAAVGCHGVAEAAALAGAGEDAVLLLEKNKSARATCAIARSKKPVDIEGVGRGRGSLVIVGMGPGGSTMRSKEAEQSLATASDIVGYHLYLHLLTPLTEGKRLHGFELGEEQTRAKKALELATRGRDVVLVSSGDAGIYAMASPLFEILEAHGNHGFALRVVPGISAMQAAAARSGAPLGHDFAVISLSDLLTPWERIEKRLSAALEGDFVIALYNPVSKRRGHRFIQALELLRSIRTSTTPVVIARNLGRKDERVQVVTLEEVSVDEIDMMTLLLVGSSKTRCFGDWVYTPRGYSEEK